MSGNSTGLFYAYASQFQETGPSDMVNLVFANTETCEQWWKSIQENVSSFSAYNWSSDNVKRKGPQWFSWPGASEPEAILEEIEDHAAFKDLKGSWHWKATGGNDSPLATIPIQNEQGWPISGDSSGGAGAAMTTGGEGWTDGPNWEGGVASYRVVENAFTKAKQLKDQGDDRTFGMIFAQLSMELRRKV